MFSPEAGGSLREGLFPAGPGAVVWQPGACPLPTPPEGAGTEGAGHVILKHSPAAHHFLKPAHSSQGGRTTRSISEASLGV